MATKATKLPSGNYRSQVMYKDESGKKHFASFTAPTSTEAEYKAREFELSKDRLSDTSKWTLKEAINSYITLKRPVLSPTTIRAYEKIRDYAFQSLMDIPIGKLTEDMLAKAVIEEMERTTARGKPLSPKTVRNEYGLISSVLSRYIPEKTFRVDLPKSPRRIRTLPSPEEIYNAVKGTSIELPCLLAMWLSFSESEIRGLTKSKSIDGDYITIREVVVYGDGRFIRKELAKTETRNRRHKMPPYIKELIDKVDGDVIVPMLPCNLYRNLQVCLEKNNIPKISFHDLRHVSASTMAALSIPTKYAQERGGWASPYIMEKVYMETFTTERQKVDDTIDNYFQQFVK